MPDTTKSQEAPYQLYVFCGSDEVPLSSDASVMRVSPDADTVEAAVRAVEASGITAADLRTRTLFMIGSVSAHRAVLTYATLSGFAGRLLDFSDLSEVFEVRPLLSQLHEAPDAGKPSEIVPVVLDLSVESIPAEVTPELVSSVRHSKEFVAGLSSVPSHALEGFVFAAGLRHRGGVDRFPLCVIDGETLDTDAARREAASARRNRRTDDRDSLVEVEDASERLLRLRAAATASPAAVLTALGSISNAETGFWRCPRPERHSNGDANPSARLSDEGFRCFRCDVEQVDPLRLVMDARNLSPDDAADWILAVTV